tara:strand:+ start:168 stop:347 length:180 start_codon:yes stop_codon:yes gene_type:complete
MKALTPGQRRKAMEAASARQRENRSGWPSSVQREGDDYKHTYLLATEEWARRMAESKSR